MKENAENRFEIMGKKITGNIQWLLAAVLLLYPLRHAFTGVDLMDAGYALGNYRFFADMDETWKLATYLANVAGVLLSKLPFGDTWAGMNVYAGLLAGMAAACTYLVLAKHYGHRLLLFAAEFVAVSLCWAPHVILYHYLGYILMTAAVLVLYRAILTASVKKYVMAGVILGLCVAVRMPNVTYMALILPVWYGCFLDLDKENRDRTRKFPLLCMNTGFCIAGYAAGLILFLAVIGVRYGFDAYPAMVADLFGMTDTATDYKPASMVTAMLGDYIRYSKWLLLFLAYMAAGMVFFRICGHGRENLCKLLYIAGFLVLLRFCYGRGMFGFDYTDGYFSMYKLVTVFLLIVLVLCLYLVFYRKAAAQDRLWAVFLLVIIFITPLGSNNGLHPIINNLFIVAPVFMILLSHIGKGLVPERGAGLPLFAVKTVLYGILVCTAVQSVLFGMFFIFHDDASPKARLALPAASPANGMKTGTTAKEELERLAGYLKEQGLLDRKLILYGDIPALAYILDMEPAIYTTWADLDSKSASILKEELDAITAASDEVLPVVIFKAEAYMKYCEGAVAADAQAVTVKAGMLREFLSENGYQPVYRGSGYIVLTGRR